MSENTDLIRLVARAQNGDEKATAELLASAARLVYGRVFRTVRSHQVAEDLTQDALVAVLSGLPRLRNPQAFLSWLRSIAENILADHLKRPANGGDNETVADLPAEDADAHSALALTEERGRVRTALGGLAPRNRLAIELFYFHGLTCREVAEFLGVSNDAARATLSRSRRKLRRRLTTVTHAAKTHPETIVFIVSGASTFRGGPMQGRFNAQKLYMALYPGGDAMAAAAAAGLEPEQAKAELEFLQDMRLVVHQNGAQRCTMPVVDSADAELLRVWAEPIADIVIGRLDSLHDKLAVISEMAEGDLAKSTVMTSGLHMEAARRPFRSLREQLEVSTPDRGRFGSFCVAAFADDAAPDMRKLGGAGSEHFDDERGERFTYWIHPSVTRRPGIERLDQAFKPTIGEFIADKLAPVAHEEITPEVKTRIADELEIPRDRHDEFWAHLADLHAAGKRDGKTVLTVPCLPLAPWKEYGSILDGIGREINETVADAAEDLRKRALHCSFADCYFADSVFAFFSYLEWMVKDAIIERQWTHFPDEADYSWGAMIVA